MTVEQSGQLKSVAMQKSSMISDKQKIKMHEAAQRQLYQMTDVEGELHKNHQQTASRIHRAAERDLSSSCAETEDHPQIRCRQSNKVVAAKAFVNVDEPYEEAGNSNAGFGHLLILANSAELLESEGQCHVEESLDVKQVDGDMEDENAELRVRGNIRLTQIKRKARLGNPHRIQETHVSERHDNADLRRSGGTYCGKGADADQSQKEMADHLPLPTDSNNGEMVNAAQVQRATAKQDVQDAQLLALSLQELGRAPPSHHIQQSLPLVKIPEAPKDRRCIAREMRRVRVIERRKQRHETQFQWMTNTQTRQMFGSHHRLEHAIDSQNNQSYVGQQQWSLYMSHMERERQLIASQQRRAQRIDEQRALRNMQQLNNSHLMKRNHSEEGIHNSNVVEEHDFVSVEVNHSIPQSTNAKTYEDQYRDLQQQTTNVENREKFCSVERQMRFTRLKHEARLKNSLSEMNNWKKLDCQSNEDQHEKLQQQTTNPEMVENTSVKGRIRLTQLKRKARMKSSPLEMKNGKKFCCQGNEEEESRS